MKNLSALEAVLDYDKPSRRFLDELNENQMKDPVRGNLRQALLEQAESSVVRERHQQTVCTTSLGSAHHQEALEFRPG
ncbi:hypothetical protein ACUX1R_20550 [Salmonella enterica]